MVGATCQASGFRVMMILDTNVLSALMHNEPDAKVIAWLDRQPADSVWVTSITVFEIHFGMALLAEGKRRRRLVAAFELLLEEDLEQRILNFDEAAAIKAASLAARRQQRGHGVDMRDTQIAGIALARRAALATRNLRHFSDLDVDVVNPWG